MQLLEISVANMDTSTSDMVDRSAMQDMDLSIIKPHDESKPCPLANLPTELRLMIYRHTQQSNGPWSSFEHYRVGVPRGIRSLCRATRFEVLSEYLILATIDLQAKKSGIYLHKTPLECFHPIYRNLLPRNRHVKVHIHLHFNRTNKSKYTMGWLRRNANLFDIDLGTGIPTTKMYSSMSRADRRLLAFFCRLAHWWLRIRKLVKGSVPWDYRFEPYINWNHKRKLDPVEVLSKQRAILITFQNDLLDCLKNPRMPGIWVMNGACGSEMKEEANKMFDAMQKWWKGKSNGVNGGEWVRKMDELRAVAEKW